MSGYIETTDDNGGVHLNSGIPNRAFHLAATAIGGSSAEGAGRIWYAALGAVEEDVDFAGFAAACVAAAGPHVEAVRAAWTEVGVLGGAAPASLLLRRRRRRRPAGSSRCAAPAGIAGRTVAGSLDLDGDDPRIGEVRSLVDRVDLAAVAPGRMHPDAFVYDFVVGGQSTRVVGSDLPDDLRRLAELLLSDGR